MILGKQDVTLRRFDGAITWDEDGAAVEPATVDTPIRGSVQPLNGDELQTLPEGVRSKKTRKFYTKSEIRVEDQHTGTKADHVIIDGETYQARTVERYGRGLRHYKATLVRVDEGAS